MCTFETSVSCEITISGILLPALYSSSPMGALRFFFLKKNWRYLIEMDKTLYSYCFFRWTGFGFSTYVLVCLHYASKIKKSIIGVWIRRIKLFIPFAIDVWWQNILTMKNTLDGVQLCFKWLHISALSSCKLEEE